MKCTRCNGALIPDRDIHGKTQSVGCINCGHRIFRGLNIHQPSAFEKNTLAGTKRHTTTRRHSHV